MTQPELIAFAEAFYRRNIEIMKMKNADYTGSSEDALINFKAIEILTGMEQVTEIGLVTRMMDKMMRILSYLKNGTLQGENVDNDIRDLPNYCVFLAAYLESKNDTK